MTNSRHDFNAVAKVLASKPKYPPPFSLRLTYEERARLGAQRGDKPLSVYIRECQSALKFDPLSASNIDPLGGEQARRCVALT